MRIAASALLFLLDYAAFTWLASRARRRPLPFSAAIGLGLLVAWQAVVAVGLSVFTAVNGVSLAVAACIPPAVVVLWVRRGPGGVPSAGARGCRSLCWTLVAYGWTAAVVFPLAALLAIVATAYAPSNWDSMTYHLARVAHWIQHGSVAAYQTNILRQNFLAPGAEYLLLGLQAVGGSDRLANGLQYVAWLVVVACAAPLARLAGAPRPVASWAGPVVAGAPMAVLQATSTQNDLLASVIVLSLVAATLPLLHPRRPPRPGDLLVLGALLGAGFLVKVTAIVCVAPFLALAFGCWARATPRWPARAALHAAVGGVALALAVAGPLLLRLATSDVRSQSLATPYLFRTFGDWGARGENLSLSALRHFPTRLDLLSDLAGHPAGLPRFHEDFAVNPIQAAFATAGFLLLVVSWRRLPRRSLWAGAAVLCAWVLFQVTFRPNPWISRLETPLFALVPLAMGGWAVLKGPRPRQAAMGTAGVASVALGVLAAIHNPPRPALGAFSARDDVADYYANRPSERPAHDAALAAAGNIGCRRIGLFIGEDSYDYPLTWRAMMRGIEVRHVSGPDSWPCVLVSDRSEPPPEGRWEQNWQPVPSVLSRHVPNQPMAGGVWMRKP